MKKSLDVRNAELEKKLEKNPIDEQIATIAKDVHRGKRNQVILALSILLDLLLTVGFGYLAIQSSATASRAESNETALIARCEETNKARVKNAALWNYLIDQSEPAPRTPEQQKFRDDFITLKNETFAPTDCSKLKT